MGSRKGGVRKVPMKNSSSGLAAGEASPSEGFSVASAFGLIAVGAGPAGFAGAAVDPGFAPACRPCWCSLPPPGAVVDGSWRACACRRCAFSGPPSAQISSGAEVLVEVEVEVEASLDGEPASPVTPAEPDPLVAPPSAQISSGAEVPGSRACSGGWMCAVPACAGPAVSAPSASTTAPRRTGVDVARRNRRIIAPSSRAGSRPCTPLFAAPNHRCVSLIPRVPDPSGRGEPLADRPNRAASNPEGWLSPRRKEGVTR